MTSNTTSRRVESRLGGVLASLMAVQAALGLARPDLYRDVAWITASWFGNDLATLLVAAPLLVLGRAGIRRGSPRARLIVLGVTAYACYNYAFYLLGATLNAWFPLYVALLVIAVAGLVAGYGVLRESDIEAVHGLGSRARALGGYFVLVAIGLATAWLGMWAAHVFFGRPTPVEPEVFRLVAALDLTLMVPALILGGVLLWRGQAWGIAVAATAGVQASLYLFVLSLNSVAAIQRGLAAWPGQLPLWGVLFVATTVATLALLERIRPGVSR